jgi:amino acid adenylation domain-containing protein
MSASNIEDIYELTPLQHVMLFSTLYAPDSGVYFESVSSPLRGVISINALKKAWQKTVDRHGVLRTSFHWEEMEKPVQVVHRRLELPITNLDWRTLSHADQAEALQTFLEQDRRQGFELDQAPLLRVTFIRLGEMSWHFIWSFHHILLDGWSVQLVLKDVFEYYGALCRGQDLNLPPTLPYSSYIAWIQQQDITESERHWRRTLQGFTAPTRFGVDEVSRKADDDQGRYVEQRLWVSTATTSALQLLSKQHRLTMNTLVQGAWAILLSRYSGEEDVVFGAVSSGRPPSLPGVEVMVGMFINTLPIRCPVVPHGKTIDWLNELQAAQSEARRFEHSDLIQVQGWSEVPRGSLLFESVLVFENYPIPEAFQQQRGTNDEEVQFIERTNVPLTLLFAQGNRLLVRALYECNRFDHATIKRLLGHYEVLLGAIANHSAQPIAELPLLTEPEEHEILARTHSNGSASSVTETVVNLFDSAVRQHQEATAFLLDGERLSYRELNNRADRVAQRLAALSLPPESIVAACFEPSFDVPAVLLGIFKAGAVYLPLNPSDSPEERLRFGLEDAEVSVLLTHSAIAARFPSLGSRCRVICVDEDEGLSSSNGQTPVAAEIKWKDSAYVLYTSGSSGKPKAVVAEHGQLLNRLLWMWEEYPFQPGEVACQRTPLTFIDSLWELLGPLLKGIPTVIVPEQVRKEPDTLVQLLADTRVSRIWLVPSLLQALLDTQPDLEQRLPDLRFWVSTGESLTTPLAQRFRDALPKAELYNLYGTTEVWDAAWHRVGDAHWHLPRVPIGRPIRNMHCLILDQARRPVPIGVPGELHIGGAGLARSYLRRPELTAARFVRDPVRNGETRLYRTGDRARYLPDGLIECLGRLDDQVKLRGHRIELGEVESVLRRQPGVKDAVVLVREDRSGDARLVAYVIQDPDYQGQGEDLDEATWGEEHVPRWQEIWDATYGCPSPADKPILNAAGFKSSYTGEPIPPDQVREWVELAVDRVLAHRPRKVLEIGCGAGLLLLQIAPHCAEYVGTDFSEPALAHLRRQLELFPCGDVRLLRRTADEFGGIEPRSFDTVILHSVVQYFPGTNYLLKVLEGAVECTAPGGTVFIGDVRNLRLLEAFHTVVALARAPGSMLLTEFQTFVRKRIIAEKELVLDPTFFAALKRHLPRVSAVHIEPKSGLQQNEFTRFRYNVLLRIDAPPAAPEKLTRIDWQKDHLDIDAAGERLRAVASDSVLIKGVPNAAVTSELALARFVEQNAQPHSDEQQGVTVAEVRLQQLEAEPSGVLPAEWFEFARRNDYKATLLWAGPGTDDHYDVLCEDARVPDGEGNPATLTAEPARARPWCQYANNPLQALFLEKLVPRIRAELQKELPDYMVPSAFVLLDGFPKTQSGKVDRRALPPPELARPLLSSEYAAPRNLTEQVVADIWAELLGLKSVGIHDNFFTELGGHSLLATQIMSRIRVSLGVEMSVRSLFEAPTIAQLATIVGNTKRALETGAEAKPATVGSGSNTDDFIPRLDREHFRAP